MQIYVRRDEEQGYGLEFDDEGCVTAAEGAADEAGVRVGWTITHVDGDAVAHRDEIYARLRERFARKRPWLDVMSKSELVPPLGGALCADLEGLWGEEDEAEAEKTAAFLRSQGALAVSAEEDVGLGDLREVIRTLLVKHRATLENLDEEAGGRKSSGM